MSNEWTSLLLAVLCLSSIVSISTDADFWSTPAERESFEDGEKQYKMIQQQMPRYGDCWKAAVSKLHTGCKKLTEEVQSRLALDFADCFLRKAGRRGCDCPEEQPVSECLREADDTAFASYTEFFTHTQSICFFLQNQAWQEATDDTILRLTTSSAKVSFQLEKAGDVQGEILKLQEKSVSAQQQLLENGANLNEELERSREGVRNIFEEFRASTGEQRLLIGEVFDRVASLQTLVLGEFTGLYSYLFYALAVLIVYLLTATPRTSGARFWLLGVCTANVVAERVVVAYLVQEENTGTSRTGGQVLDSSSALYQQVWLCRKVTAAVALCLLAWFSARYKDYNLLNNHLLTEIHKQNLELKSCLQTMGHGYQVPLLNGHVNTFTSSALVHSPKNYESDDSTYDSTFVYTSSEDESEGSENSFASIQTTASRQSRSGTPVRDLLMNTVPIRLKDVATTSSTSKQFSQENNSMEEEPLRRYNLRTRGKNSPNPLVQNESPKTFESVVKKLAHISQRNGNKVKALRRTKYSSDEESI